MALIVQKYGGTSVGDAERIKSVAERIVDAVRVGNQVCVVVSAMGHSTDELVSLAAQVSEEPNPRELDMLLTSGERISMALLSMVISDLGYEAISLTGSQAGIVTDTTHGKARILEVKGDRVRQALAANKIAIVAGFQGVSTAYDVTTLGRGGSDTTAVALAAALGADRCEIYTDVDGVYTADPRIVPAARKLHAVSYEEMLEMAASGSGVLMLRAVEYARKSWSCAPRALLLRLRGGNVDQRGGRAYGASDHLGSGPRHFRGEGRHSKRARHSGYRRAVFRPLADEGVNIDMIVQNVSDEGRTDISFTMPTEDLKQRPIRPR